MDNQSFRSSSNKRGCGCEQQQQQQQIQHCQRFKCNIPKLLNLPTAFRANLIAPAGAGGPTGIAGLLSTLLTIVGLPLYPGVITGSDLTPVVFPVGIGQPQLPTTGGTVVYPTGAWSTTSVAGANDTRCAFVSALGTYVIPAAKNACSPCDPQEWQFNVRIAVSTLVSVLSTVLNAATIIPAPTLQLRRSRAGSIAAASDVLAETVLVGDYSTLLPAPVVGTPLTPLTSEAEISTVAQVQAGDQISVWINSTAGFTVALPPLVTVSIPNVIISLFPNVTGALATANEFSGFQIEASNNNNKQH